MKTRNGAFVGFEISVTRPVTNVTRFVFRLHLANKPDELIMEPAFYQQGGGEIPQGRHHEVEILTPSAVWTRADSHVHYHEVPGDGRRFVCWTGCLPSMIDVRKMLRVWCVGTAYTLTTGKDFNPLIAGMKGGIPAFLEQMRDRGYEIVDDEA